MKRGSVYQYTYIKNHKGEYELVVLDPKLLTKLVFIENITDNVTGEVIKLFEIANSKGHYRGVSFREEGRIHVQAINNNLINLTISDILSKYQISGYLANKLCKEFQSSH